MIRLLNQPITVRHTIAKEILKALNFKAVCTTEYLHLSVLGTWSVLL